MASFRFFLVSALEQRGCSHNLLLSLLLSHYIILLSYFFHMFGNQTKLKNSTACSISLKFLLFSFFFFSSFLFDMSQHLKFSSGSFNVFQPMKTLVQLTCKCYKLLVLSWCTALFHLCLNGEYSSFDQPPVLKCQNFP